jgi:mannose-6-phosphate isomerase-like protein (cupin superfamily)
MTNEMNYQLHDLHEIASRFPDTADSILVDCYLSDAPEASARLFRIYQPLPMHFHKQCDEHLYLYSGELAFQIENDEPALLSPGQLVTFKREVVHGITEIRATPALFLAVDTPRRAPDDVHFVDATSTDRSFVTHLEAYQ